MFEHAYTRKMLLFFFSAQLLISVRGAFVYQGSLIITDRTLIRAEEGPEVLHAPPTAHMVQSISTIAVAVDTLGENKWRHHGDFSISTLNPPKPLQKLGKLNNFFSQILIQIWPFEGVKGGN